MEKNYDVITLVLKYLYTLKKLGVTGFVDIIKIAIMLIKTTFRNSIRVKRIPNCVLKCNFIFISGYKKISNF